MKYINFNKNKKIYENKKKINETIFISFIFLRRKKLIVA